MNHAFLWTGTGYECHSGHSGEVYHVGIAFTHWGCRVTHCTCDGYKFRRNCSHCRELAAYLD